MTSTNRFLPSPIPDRPLLINWREWLASFWRFSPPIIEGDALVTTYLSCGAVILTSLVVGSTDFDLVARATSLPPRFVKLVLSSMDEQDVWCLDSVYEFRELLKGAPSDFSCVGSRLGDVIEDFWDFCWTPAVGEELEKFRGGIQVGGFPDTWINEEEEPAAPPK